MGAQGTIRLALAFATLLGSLTLVVWRQGRALEALRELDRTRSARAVAESERAKLLTRIQHLESRTRVLSVATERLGMRIPAAGEEIVILLRGDGVLPVPSDLGVAREPWRVTAGDARPRAGALD